MASATKSAWKNPSYLQSSFGIFMFFCSWGIWWSFFQRWLISGVGLTNAEVGTIYSINSLATLVIMFVYGVIQDQLGIKRKLVIVVSVIAACVGPFVQFVYAPMILAGGTTRWIGALIGSIVLSAGFMSGCSLFEAVTERYSRKFGFEYGQSRAWGSFGYAIVALCAGFLFNINPLINFWVGSAFGLGMLLVYAFWVPAEQKEELKKETDPNAAPTNPSLKEMVAVLKMPTLWVLIVFMLLTNTFYTVFDQQMFPTYYANLFPTEEIGNATYGTLNGFQVFLESAMMGVVPIIMKKIGVRNALLLGATVMFLRHRLVRRVPTTRSPSPSSSCSTPSKCRCSACRHSATSLCTSTPSSLPRCTWWASRSLPKWVRSSSRPLWGALSTTRWLRFCRTTTWDPRVTFWVHLCHPCCAALDLRLLRHQA